MAEIDLGPAYLAVTDGLHCGVEPTGREIIDYLAAGEPVTDLCLIPSMHPEAVRKGVRFIANAELGAHFTEWVRTAPMEVLDRDQVAARRFMDAPMPHFWLGIDPHDSPAERANSLQVSNICTPTQLGVAGAMNLQNVIVLPYYPFLERNTEFVLVESTRDPVHNPLSQPHFWKDCLSNMAKLGPDGMEKLGLEIYHDLNYFVKSELLRIDDDGNPDSVLIERISKLEGHAPIGPYFTPVDTSHPLFAQYPSLTKYSDRLHAGYWDDQNHSPERPDILGYRADGRPRRIAFGSVLLRISISDFTLVQAPRFSYFMKPATNYGD